MSKPSGVLPRDVVDLATRSLGAEVIERHRGFPVEIQKIKVELAAKGIYGGPTYSIVSNAARNECEARVDIAAAQLQRAAESKGVRFYQALGADFGTALEELSTDLCTDVDSQGRQALAVIPNAAGGMGRFQSELQMARMSRVAKGRTDLEHYAESLHTREQERRSEARLKLGQALLAAAIGAALTLLAQWVAHLTGIS